MPRTNSTFPKAFNFHLSLFETNFLLNNYKLSFINQLFGGRKRFGGGRGGRAKSWI